MKFLLSQDDFKILQKFDCGFDHVKNIKKLKNNNISFEVDDSALDDFQVDMTSDIIHKGMDNQDEVNKLGVDMYRVHDLLLC